MCSQCEFDACLISVVQLAVRARDGFSRGVVGARHRLSSAVPLNSVNFNKPTHSFCTFRVGRRTFYRQFSWSARLVEVGLYTVNFINIRQIVIPFYLNK